MDDELQELEAELKRLRPAGPSRGLASRIEREVGARQARRTISAWWLWAGAVPFAAALAIMTIFSADRESGPSGDVPLAMAAGDVSALAPFQPVAAENILYAARDEGLVTLTDGTPARRERLNYVDTITWRNPRTNASVRWSVPREEVRVVPVSFQ